jgi:DNA transformation protein
MNDATFRDFILDQLQPLGPVDYRPMFGSYGLYHDGVFFGILARGRLYFKTDTVTRTVYLQHGMKPFRPNARQTLQSYYEVPVEVLEDDRRLTAWARQALACQTAQRARRTPRRRQ